MQCSIPATLRNAFVGLLVLSLCLLPMTGLHFHLPETHLGADLHTHGAETHAFHLHVVQHDGIDTENAHPSDAQQISLDTDARIAKVFKFLAILLLAVFVLTKFAVSCSIIPPDYPAPFRNTFEIYRALLRGPPVV